MRLMRRSIYVVLFLIEFTASSFDFTCISLPTRILPVSSSVFLFASLSLSVRRPTSFATLVNSSPPSLVFLRRSCCIFNFAVIAAIVLSCWLSILRSSLSLAMLDCIAACCAFRFDAIASSFALRCSMMRFISNSRFFCASEAVNWSFDISSKICFLCFRISFDSVVNLPLESYALLFWYSSLNFLSNSLSLLRYSVSSFTLSVAKASDKPLKDFD